MKQMTRNFYLLFIAFLSSLTTLASDFNVDGIYYNITSKENFTVQLTANPDGYQGNVTIPENVTNDGTTYSVTSIADNAFSGSSALASVTIPATIRTIGEYAFKGCSSLKSVTIPENVTSVGNGAFQDCSALERLTFNARQCGYFGIYNCSALGCSNIKEVTIGNEVECIPRWMFWDCSGLTSIKLPESLTYIGDAAFYGCSGLTSVEIPSKMTYICYMAFNGCTGLKSIILPDGLTGIGEIAFGGCTGLASVQCLATNVPSACNAFGECDLTNVTLTVPSSALKNYTSASPWNSFGFISASTESSLDKVVVGDMNSDSKLTTEDINILSESVLGKGGKIVIPNHNQIVVGDMNNDDKLSIEDISILTETSLNRIPQHTIYTEQATHDYVDLGLSDGTKWATTNIGADSQEQFGDYFAWGETSSKLRYEWSTYFDSVEGSSSNFNKYATDKKQELDKEDDAAYVNWGPNWRMPSYAQALTLMNETYHEWTWNFNNTGRGGIIFYKAKSTDDKGKWDNPSASYTLEDTYIFIPAAGYCYPYTLNWVGSSGYLWTRTLQPDNSGRAYGIHFYCGGHNEDYLDRFCGHCIRPVLGPTLMNESNVTVTFADGGTDLKKNDECNYFMTYQADGSHPSVEKVCDKSTGAVLTEGTDYTITNPEDYNVGHKKYVITFKGKYEGEVTINLNVRQESSKIPCYWGYTEYWTTDDLFGILGERLKDDYIVNNDLPDNKFTAVMTDESDGTKSFTLRVSEYMALSDINPEKYPNVCYCYWWAIPTSNTIVKCVENGLATISASGVDNTFRVNNSDIIDGGNNDAYTININGTDYYVYAYKSQMTAVCSKNHLSETFEVIIKEKSQMSLKFDYNKGKAMLSSGRYELPVTNKPGDCNGTITYTSSDTNIGEVIEENGKYYVQLNGTGEVTITAKVTGSNYYEYVPNNDSFTLKVIGNASVYYGYTPYWNYAVYDSSKEGVRLADILKEGKLPNNKEDVEMTGSDDTTFTMRGSEWYNKYNEKCTIWWFAVPVDYTIDSVIESGIPTTSVIEEYAITNNDVYENEDNSKFVVNVDGTDYYIYSHITSKAYYASQDNASYLTITLRTKTPLAFKFSRKGDNVALKAGRYELPLTSKPDDCDGTITYTSSDTGIGEVIEDEGKYYVQLKGAGEVTITATIGGSTTYDYVPNTSTFTLKIVDEAPIYWGFTPYWSYNISKKGDEERLKYTLQSGDLPSNKILAEMTDNGDGTKSFEVSASDYYNNYYLIDSVKYPIPCTAWWFALPVDTTIVSALENGHSPWSGQDMIYYFRLNDSDVNGEGTSDTFIINVDGVNYYVFTSIDSLAAYVSEYTSSFVFKIIIK